MDLLTAKAQPLFEYLLNDYSRLFAVDVNEYRAVRLNGKLLEQLSQQWYNDLKQEHQRNIYAVYNHEYYVIDLFNCFIAYSRDYIKRLIKAEYFRQLQGAKVIVDLGCGLGYSTSLLTQVFPNAKVYATNISGTKQWAVCEIMAQRSGFTLVRSIHEVYEQVDIVFASEYFEHIRNPIEHAADIISAGKPRHLLIANSFNTWSMGHFTHYDVYGTTVSQDKISRMFNQYLRANQYESIKCGLWNNKPTVWKRL